MLPASNENITDEDVERIINVEMQDAKELEEDIN